MAFKICVALWKTPETCRPPGRYDIETEARISKGVQETLEVLTKLQLPSQTITPLDALNETHLHRDNILVDCSEVLMKLQLTSQTIASPDALNEIGLHLNDRIFNISGRLVSHRNTSKWIEDPHWRDWLNGETQPLFVTCLPGKGKTAVMKHLVELLASGADSYLQSPYGILERNLAMKRNVAMEENLVSCWKNDRDKNLEKYCDRYSDKRMCNDSSYYYHVAPPWMLLPKIHIVDRFMESGIDGSLNNLDAASGELAQRWVLSTPWFYCKCGPRTTMIPLTVFRTPFYPMLEALCLSWTHAEVGLKSSVKGLCYDNLNMKQEMILQLSTKHIMDHQVMLQLSTKQSIEDVNLFAWHDDKPPDLLRIVSSVLDHAHSWFRWVSVVVLKSKFLKRLNSIQSTNSITKLLKSFQYPFADFREGRRTPNRFNLLALTLMLTWATPATADLSVTDTVGSLFRPGISPIEKGLPQKLIQITMPWQQDAESIMSPDVLLAACFLYSSLTVLLFTIRRRDKYQKYFLTAGISLSAFVGAVCARGTQDFVFRYLFLGVDFSLIMSVFYHVTCSSAHLQPSPQKGSSMTSHNL